MAEVASAYVSLIPSAKGFGPGIEKQISGDTARAGKTAGAGASKTFGSSFKSGLKGIAAPIAGLFAVSKGVDFLKDSLGEAREAQKVGAQTTQVIKSTGNAAKVSAKQVGDLASAISAKTGIDDEAIQSGANLLLTFKNIKNEAGSGNDIFNQTTKIMTDMATAMGQEPKAAAIQLGKAMNDPVKGMTALTRVGVTFTEKQKAVNKALVEGGTLNALAAFGAKVTATQFAKVQKDNHFTFQQTVDYLTGPLSKAQKQYYKHLEEGGHTVEAQRNILKELNSEFKGSAAAQATAGEKAAVAWGNLKEQLGTALLPVVDKVATVFSTKVVPAISDFVTGIQTGRGVGGQFAKVARKLANAFSDAAPVVEKVFGFIVKNKAAVGTFAGVILTVVAAVKAWRIAQAALDIVLMANPIGLVVLAIAALAAGLVYAYKHSETFRAVVQAAFHGIAEAGKWMWNNVLQPVFHFLGLAIAAVMDHFGDMLDVMSHVPGFGWAKDAADKMHGAADKARELADGINKIPDHKTVHIDFKLTATNLASILAKQANDPRLVGRNATGTDFWRGGLTWVGERGPEILDLPRGSKIIPNHRIDSAVPLAGAGPQTFRGVLSIDRDGVAYIDGRAQHIVRDGQAAQAVANRRASLDHVGRRR